MTMSSVTVAMTGVIVAVTVTGSTVLKNKNAHQIDEKTQNGHNQKSFVFDLGRLDEAFNGFFEDEKTDKK